MPGKADPTILCEHVFTRTGATDDAVTLGPALGEDAAAIDWPGGSLVVSSDPISLAASRVGTLGVHVACNDVAASGADPRWLTVVILLPDGDADLEAITDDVDAAARSLGVTVVGGHTETVDALERPLLSLTAMGATEQVVPTGGASPGDRVVLAGAAGVEGTAILAADFGDQLGVDDDIRTEALTLFDDISVVPAARALRDHATAMHDPTEGGIAAAALEVAQAGACTVEIDREAVAIREETRALCAAAGVDPLRIFGSGALIATVPPARLEAALAALETAGIEGTDIGAVSDLEAENRAGAGPEPAALIDGERIEDPVTDDLYPLWAAADAE